jgi:hypothetical protein
VVEQIKSRFHDLRTTFAQPLNTLFGVGFDGRYFIFVRYRRDAWQVLRPKKLCVDAVVQFLSALAGLGTDGNRAFAPEDLAEDFAAPSQTARLGVRTLHEAALAIKDSHANVLFDQWKLQFSETCGYDIDTLSSPVRALGEAYDIAEPQPAPLFFALHTYYALVMKFIAMEIVCLYHRFPSPILEVLQTGSNNTLKTLMRDWEDGSLFRHFQIRNFLEGDLFSWYLFEWKEPVANVVRAIARTLDAYNPTTLTEDPERNRDFLKQLYHLLFPRAVRHSLGEYYTPDWLAEMTLDATGWDGNPDVRVLDPACGSGTFLVLAIGRVLQWYEEHQDSCMMTARELVGKIRENIIGFDLNPLAVLAARTNYLIALREHLAHAGGVDIPVYLCDSILTPQEKEDLWQRHALEVKTVVGSFCIPKGCTTRTVLSQYCHFIHTHIAHGDDIYAFHGTCNEIDFDWNITTKPIHTELYEKFQRLHEEGKDGIWTRILRNQFAPVFTEPVDLVVGNPPWVNWESLPEAYRRDTIKFWVQYGLFTLTRGQAQMGGGKKDLSMLMTYAAADYYLKEGGTLTFVLPQTVFKTKGAGDGFRRLRFDKGGAAVEARTTWYLAPRVVHDMSAFQPFEGATNRTAVLVCQKTREAFSYPVPYIEWRKKPGESARPDDPLALVEANTTRVEHAAEPIDSANPGSPWLTAPTAAMASVKRVIGRSAYTAHAGVYSGGVNGVYWVQPTAVTAPVGCVMVENLSNIGKRKNILRVTHPIEKDLLHPLVRGRDVRKWRATPSCHFIMSQDPQSQQGIEQSIMQRKYPCALAYFKMFEEILDQRAAYRKYFKGKKAPIHTMFGVGSYTKAPWKAVWKDMGRTIVSAVLGEQDSQLPLPEHHVMFVAAQHEQEAHYLCALLNSSLAQLLVASYTTSTGISTHVMEFLAIPQFAPDNPLHVQLATLSQRCHRAMQRQQYETLQNAEAEIDMCAAKLWGVPARQYKAVQEAAQLIRDADAAQGEMNLNED